jgi:hypothetical protein
MAQDAGEEVRATELIAAGYEPGLMQRTFRLALLQHGHIQRIYAKTGG